MTFGTCCQRASRRHVSGEIGWHPHPLVERYLRSGTVHTTYKYKPRLNQRRRDATARKEELGWAVVSAATNEGHNKQASKRRRAGGGQRYDTSSLESAALSVRLIEARATPRPLILTSFSMLGHVRTTCAIKKIHGKKTNTRERGREGREGVRSTKLVFVAAVARPQPPCSTSRCLQA